MDYRDCIITEVADAACKRICRRAIRALQSLKYTLSGDDSVLENTWDEICVQVQGEQFLSWDVYEETIHATIGYDIECLPRHEAGAIWLQTKEGIEWECYNKDNMNAPIDYDTIEDYLLHKFLFVEAGNWSNARIHEYLYR